MSRLQLEVCGDLRPQEAEQVGGAGETVAGHQLLGDGGTAHQVTSLQHTRLHALRLQVGGAYQTVVTWRRRVPSAR